MHSLRSTETQKNQNTRLAGRAEVQAAFAEQRESLYWTALMITGNGEWAEQSIGYASRLTETNSYAFRDWPVQRVHSATARLAVHAVRLSIHENAAQYADWICSHQKHEPLSPAETRTLHELDASAAIQQLDVLARAVLVLYGCQRVSLSHCALLLNVPLRCVVGAYCRALQWYHEFAEPAHKIRHPDFSLLHLVRHDPDGVPVWAIERPTATSGRQRHLDVAGFGKFSSDRTIAEYAAEIWNVQPCPLPEKSSL